MNRQILFDGHLMDGPFLTRGDGINCRNNNELAPRGLFDGCLTEGGRPELDQSGNESTENTDRHEKEYSFP